MEDNRLVRHTCTHAHMRETDAVGAKLQLVQGCVASFADSQEKGLTALPHRGIIRIDK